MEDYNCKHLLSKIKLFDPNTGKEEESAVLRVLNSHFWASGGGSGDVLKFENEFAKYIDSSSCVAVNSGTSALNLALSLLDLKGKEVIVPSLTFVATINAILINGAKPVFVDIDPKTLCLDPLLIEKSITKKTACILAVHFAGISCDLDSILKICKKFNLELVEDAAHAVGTHYKQKKIGTHGICVCFSFHPAKNLAMPTGGLISINHKNHQKMKSTLNARRWCGITNRKGTDYDVKEVGWNYYMNEFSAAIGRIQLKKLDKMNNKRKKIAKRYENELNTNKKIPFDKNCSYHMYWILVKNQKKFRGQLLDSGIETGTHYKPVHTMSMFNSIANLPITEKVGNEIVTIPIHPNLSEHDVDKIIFNINKFT